MEAFIEEEEAAPRAKEIKIVVDDIQHLISCGEIDHFIFIESPPSGPFIPDDGKRRRRGQRRGRGKWKR